MYHFNAYVRKISAEKFYYYCKKDFQESLTPRVTRVPFRDVVILRAIFAHSRYLEMFDQKWLLSLNSISYQMVKSDFFCHVFGGCHNYEFK